MRQKENYVAPELTVVEFKVEKGFAGSGEESAAAALGDMLLGEIDTRSIHMGGAMTDLGTSDGGSYFAYVQDGQGEGGSNFYSNGSFF